jgi:hypothetical protein
VPFLPVKPWQMTFVFLSIRTDMSLPAFQFGLDLFKTGIRPLPQFDAFTRQFDGLAASWVFRKREAPKRRSER